MNGPVVVVTAVGAAEGAAPLAAAVACAASEPDRAALLLELTDGRRPRPALVASAAARELEERLARHLPEAGVASRGALCHLTVPADRAGLERAPAALALVRNSLAAVHLPASLLGEAVGKDGLAPTAALLRADLDRDRALTALAVRDLIVRGVSVTVAKQPLAWVPARRALFGALPATGVGGLPPRVLRRLAIGPERTVL